jgi:enterochelin esterase-like enzyme
MKATRYLFLFCIVICTLSAISQQGKVIEEQTVKSTIRGKNVRYTIYLPPDYETSQRSYPVVYLLHGYTDDHTGWLQFGEINRYMNTGIAEGKLPPMIIVMPNGDSTFYINSFDGKDKFEDFFVKEFIPSIEKSYRIKSEKRFRGIAGLSMGGYGTLVYALKYPQLFVAAAPLSAAVLDDSAFVRFPAQSWNQPWGKLFGPNLEGQSRLTKHYYENSILKMVETKSAEDLKKVRYWIDCGDDDFLIKGNCLLHIALTEKRVPHEFRVRDGVHNWTYWRTGITDALEFIGQSFHQ